MSTPTLRIARTEVRSRAETLFYEAVELPENEREAFLDGGLWSRCNAPSCG
jgi:hypothetical protein